MLGYGLVGFGTELNAPEAGANAAIEVHPLSERRCQRVRLVFGNVQIKIPPPRHELDGKFLFLRIVVEAADDGRRHQRTVRSRISKSAATPSKDREFRMRSIHPNSPGGDETSRRRLRLHEPTKANWGRVDSRADLRKARHQCACDNALLRDHRSSHLAFCGRAA